MVHKVNLDFRILNHFIKLLTYIMSQLFKKVDDKQSRLKTSLFVTSIPTFNTPLRSKLHRNISQISPGKSVSYVQRTPKLKTSRI